MTVTPVNYRKQDASPEAIARDVDYALQIADFYLGKLPEGRRHLTNLCVLELGPGYSLGTAVVLACHGARVAVADRYLSPFDREYHDPFLRALLGRIQQERPELYTAPITRLLEAGTFLPDVVEGLHLGIEDLEEVPDGAFDLVVSNAVFEHVEDVPRAYRILARITRPGGLGIHQVDFRDHRDFSRPLEYLTMPAQAFAELFRDVHGECGNRWRPAAMQTVIEEAGFDVSEFDANMFADDGYLAGLLPRLDDDYRGMDRDALRAISGCFVLRHRPAPGAVTEGAADSPVSLAQTASRYAFVAPWVGDRRVLDLGCGSGTGARALLAAGAADVMGVDRDVRALEEARIADPRGAQAWDAYLAHDLERPLPYADCSFDVLVAFDVLAELEDQPTLCAELARLLTPDGVAFVSVPNPAFEEHWIGQGAAPDGRSRHVPGLDELVELLSAFEWVDFHGQVDLVASLVLPLDGAEDERAPAALVAPAGASPADRATARIVARCFRSRPVGLPHVPPVAHAVSGAVDRHGRPVAVEQALLTRLAESAQAHLGRGPAAS